MTAAFLLGISESERTRKAPEKYCATKWRNNLQTADPRANPDISCACAGILYAAQESKIRMRAIGLRRPNGTPDAFVGYAYAT
jgi:hypothetical protein